MAVKEKSGTLSRRDFLKQSGLSAVALPLLNQAGTPAVQSAGQPGNRKSAAAPVPVLCGMCRQMCPLLVRVEETGAIDISGNPASPLHGGKICGRALAAANLLVDPDRLRYPLKRTGKRGAGIWQRISWEEAIETIVSRLHDSIKLNGPQGAGLFCGRFTSRCIVELFRQLGIANIAPAGANFCLEGGLGYPDYGEKQDGHVATGQLAEAANVGLYFGSHLGENINIAELRQILALRENGGKVILCDPRFSVLAGKADYHLMLRPGTDTTVIFGWLRAILDFHFDRFPFTAGGNEAMAALRRQLEPFTPAYVSRFADIDEGILIDSARLLADPASRVRVRGGRFAAWHGNDSQRLFAIRLLFLVLDCLHSPSPALTDSFGPVVKFLAGSGQAASGTGTVRSAPGYGLLTEMLAEKVKVVGVWGSNPFHCYPNPYRTADAFKKADFVFCCDLYPTEATLYADIILPEASFLESQNAFTSWTYEGGEIVGAGFSALSPRFESRSAAWIVEQLGSQFGASLFDGQGVLLRDRVFLAARGLAPDAFQSGDGIIVLPAAPDTRTGLDHVEGPSEDSHESRSDQSDENGIDVGPGNNPASFAEIPGVPPIIDVSSAPAGFARFFSGRLPAHTGSSTQDNSWLRLENSENELWINDRVAAAMGLIEGERVHLVNQDGIRSITAIKLKATPGIRADCVYTPHGFGCFSPHMRKSFGKGLADGSMLTRTRTDAASGRPGLRCNFVKLVKNGALLSFPPREGQDEGGSFPLLFPQGMQAGKE